MSNIKLDIPDITVVINTPTAISVNESGNYFIVADTATSAITSSYAITSSFALSALTSSYALNATAIVPAGTVSSSLQFNSVTLPFTGSFTGSFRGVLTGSMFGTASVAVSSSRATTSSFAVSSSRATTSSFSVTASFVDYTNVANKPAGIVSSSTQINTGSFTGSFIGVITSASFATTASYVAGAVADWNTLANKPAGIVSSSTQINTGSFSGSFTGTFTGTASVAAAATSASFAPTILPSGIVSSSRQINTGSFTGSFIGALIGTSSYANNANLLDGLDSFVFATTGSNQFNGNQTIIGSVTSSRVLTDAVRFNTSAGVSVGVGELAWNNSDGTLDLGMTGGNVVQQIGQELFYEVRNETGIEIPNGTAVYANGVTAGSARITASPYTADGSVREVRFLGIATEDISNGVNGFVTHFGYVRGLDTRGTTASSIAVGDETWAVGDILYVHPTVAGKLTNVKPEHAITVAIIITRHQSVGVLFVRPSSGGHLEDIHDILINTGSLTNGQVLSYNSTSGLWENTNQINTSSFATTGSNRFNGNQTITGSLIQGLEGNIATGDYSHAEGSVTKAIGNYSHAEGDYTQAIGDYSHAEGQETIASGSYSHAEGYQTIALANHQHVQGQWNAVSSVPAAFIVGNGTDDSNRSNLIYAAGNEVQITGSLNVKNGITGSLFGTSSQAVTASYVLPTGLPTDIVSSSAQVTAFLPTGTVSSSRQINTGSFSGSITTASFATSASYALSASFAPIILPSGTVSSSSQINTGSFTGSFRGIFSGDGSQLTGLVASGVGVSVADGGVAQGNAGQLDFGNFITATIGLGTASINVTLPTGTVSSSVQINTGSFTGSFTGIATTASFATTASYASTFDGYVNFPVGLDVSGSLVVTGSASITGSVSATGGFTGSLFGTSSVATSSSFAVSASWAPSSAGSGVTSITVSDGLSGGVITTTGTIRLDTGSVHFLDGVKKELNTEGVISSSRQINTGSFTGSFTGILSGSVFGTASGAVSSSYALYAGFAEQSINTITVTNNGTSHYLLDGVVKPVVTFVPGTTYRFDTSGVIGGHPFRFSLTENGPTEYTFGVTVGTNYTEINVDYATSSSLFYYCTAHSGMGNQANTLRSENLITASQTGSMRVLSSSYASTASVAISSSFATTASAATSITFTPATSSFATTASYALNATAIVPPGTVSSSQQINTGSFTGSFIGIATSASFATTASYAVTASTADTFDGYVNFPAGLVVTGSFVTSGSASITGSVSATGGFTGSLFGSSSFATSASFAVSASWAPSSAGSGVTSITAGDGLSGGVITTTGTIRLDTGSVHFLDGVKKELNTEGVISSSRQINTGSFTGSFIGIATSASFATTASYALNAIATLPPGVVSSSGQISYVGLSNIPANIVSSSGQVTAFLPNGTVSSSIQINTGSFTGSFIGTHSGSTFGTASFATSASFATTASYANTFDGYVTFPTGLDVTGSFVVTGSVSITGSVSATGGFTGSLFGSSSFAITSSFATSASFAPTILPSGVVSSSGQVSYTGLSNIPTNIVSSSTQVTAFLPTGTVSSSGQVSYTGLSNIPLGIVSSSGQVSYIGLSNIPAGIVSSSAQVVGLLPTGTVSSSIQINTGSFTGSFVGRFTGSLFGTASNSTSSSFAVSASWAPSSAGSGVTSITVSDGLSGGVITTTGTIRLDTGSVHFLDGVKKELNTEGVVSSSLQINTGSFTGSFTGTLLGTSSNATSASYALSASYAPGGGTTFPYTGAAVISGSLIVTGSSGVTVTGPVTITGALQATTKSFKIDHQRLLGKKLIYGVLEGPEHGVYVRGRLTKNTVIQLPEEWEWLVDPTSITVQLTPIATQQLLYVQNIENNTVIINSSTPIDCFYYVQATRKDVAPLTILE